MNYIKFWNQDTKEMTKPFSLEMYFNPDQYGYRVTVDREVMPTNKSKMLFSTGHKDSKGNEIFQDDLIRTKAGKVILVQWLSVGWTSHILFEEKEIIGNIHENPELYK